MSTPCLVGWWVLPCKRGIEVSRLARSSGSDDAGWIATALDDDGDNGGLHWATMMIGDTSSIGLGGTRFWSGDTKQAGSGRRRSVIQLEAWNLTCRSRVCFSRLPRPLACAFPPFRSSFLGTAQHPHSSSSPRHVHRRQWSLFEERPQSVRWFFPSLHRRGSAFSQGQTRPPCSDTLVWC